MNKQIEEMAEYLFKNPMVYDTYCREDCRCISIILHEAGYRKQSETAREIFAEIERILCSLDKRHMMCGNPKQSWGVRSAMAEIAQLKKKYEVQEDDQSTMESNI